MSQDLDDLDDGQLVVLPPKAIVLSPKLPAGKMVLVDDSFMAALETAEAQLAVFRIVDDASADDAAKLQKFLTSSGTALDAARMQLLRPLIDARDEINAAARNAAARIELSKSSIKAKLTAWSNAQRALAAERERKRQEEEARLRRERQAEIDRLERIRQAEIAEAKRKADALLREQQEAERLRIDAENKRLEAEKAAAAKSAVDDLDEDVDPITLPHLPIPGPEPLRADYDEVFPPPPPEKSETEKRLEVLRIEEAKKPAAPIVAPKIQGVAFRTTLEIVSTDIDQLPESFVTRTVNLQELRKVYVTGWKEGAAVPVCPGVVFNVKRESVTR